MPDLTPERLARLRGLAELATPGPWDVDSVTRYDVAPSATDWRIPDLERWCGYTNAVGFGEDEATARYVAAVSPDVVTALLDEIERLRSIIESQTDTEARSGVTITVHPAEPERIIVPVPVEGPMGMRYR